MTQQLRNVSDKLPRRLAQLQALAEAALTITRAPTLEATLNEVTAAARTIIGAHQSVVSLTRGPDWGQAINAIALSDKYARWRTYDSVPDGSGIYALVCEENRPMRLTQAELAAHPRWRGFGPHAKDHPPMRGWLAAPLVGRDGRNLGLIQVSDKEDGSDFDEADEAILVQLAQFASAAVEQTRAAEGMRESEAQLRRVLDQLFAFVGVLDVDGTLLEANRAPLERAGLTIEDVRGKKFWNCYWWSYDPAVQQRLRDAVAAAAQGEVVRYDVDVRVAGGRLITIDFQVAPLRNEQGRVTHLIPSGNDIAERKRAEEQLRRSHDTFYHLIQNNPFGVYVVDADFRLRQVSLGAQKVFQNVCPLLGRDFAEVLRIIWPEPFAGEAIGRFRHTLETGEPYSAPSTIERRADTRDIEAYDWRIERITLPDGRFGVVCYFYDLSERQEWEASLRESEQRFRATFENAAVGIAHVAPDGAFLAVNEQLCRITGYAAEEFLSKTFQDITHPDDLEADLGFFHRVLAREIESYSMEKRYLRKDGSAVWVNLTRSCVRKADGAVDYFVGVVEDITGRKRAEQNVQFLMRELSHRSKNLLTVVQAIARQTARHAEDMDVFQEQLATRIAALASAYDLLVSQNWQGAPLHDVVARQLEAFVAFESGRVNLNGPEVSVDAAAAQNVALAIHELATNASKHGALANAQGEIAIDWGFLPAPNGGKRFQLRWSERGGPPVRPGGRRGFGTFVLERMVGAGLGGHAKLQFLPDGLVWTLLIEDCTFLRIAEDNASAGDRSVRQNGPAHT